MNHLYKISTFLLLLCSLNINAQCMKSNEISSPPLYMNKQNERILVFFISNVSDQTITTSMTLFDKDGQTFLMGGSDSIGYLSGFPTQAGGITMQPNTSGFIVMKGDNVERVGYAKIQWESQTCLPHAMTANIEHQYDANGKFSLHATSINGGNAF